MKYIGRQCGLALAILVSGHAVALCASSYSHPGSAHDLGVGVMLGSPTGLTAKYWYTGLNAVDAGLGWNFGQTGQLQMHADHLWHMNLDSLKVSQGRLPVYIGLGLRVLAGDDSEAGIRIPLGLSYLFGYIPLEAFAEVAPVVRFAPDTGGDVDGGIGIRYYFK